MEIWVQRILESLSYLVHIMTLQADVAGYIISQTNLAAPPFFPTKPLPWSASVEYPIGSGD